MARKPALLAGSKVLARAAAFGTAVATYIRVSGTTKRRIVGRGNKGEKEKVESMRTESRRFTVTVCILAIIYAIIVGITIAIERGMVFGPVQNKGSFGIEDLDGQSR
jgi:hypothetical protein